MGSTTWLVSFLQCTNRPDHCFDILTHDQFTDSVVHTYVYSLVQVGLYPFTLFINILLLNRVSDSINKVDASLFNIIHITDTLEYCNTALYFDKLKSIVNILIPQ